MDITTKIQQSEQIKNQGTRFFKAKCYSEAKNEYKKIVEYLGPEESLERDEKNKGDTLVLAAHLNIAICCLKLEENGEVISSCDAALKIDPKNEKGLFRRGQARENLGQIEMALKDFEAVKEHHPENKDTQKNIDRLHLKTKQVENKDKKEKNIYHGMFDKMANTDAKKSQKQEGKADETNAREKHPISEGYPNKAAVAGGSLSTGQQGASSSTDVGGSGGIDFASLLSDPELQELFKDHEVKQAFQDITSNPANVVKYQGIPKIDNVFKKMYTNLKISPPPTDNTMTQVARRPRHSGQRPNEQNWNVEFKREDEKDKQNRIRIAKEEYDKLRAEIEADEANGEGGLYTGKNGFPKGGYPGPAGFPGPGGFPGAGGFPSAGGFPGAGGGPGGVDLDSLCKDPDVIESLQDKDVAQAFKEISENPANIAKHQQNQKVQDVFNMFCKKLDVAPPPPPAAHGESQF